jgi:hypothetical protein
MNQLKDFLNSINKRKDEMPEGDIACERAYGNLTFVVNRCLSYHQDTLLHANLMNQHNHLDPRLQYDFFLNSIRKRNRYASWHKSDQHDDLELIKEYYRYSTSKALEALDILSPEQLEIIRKKMYKGD